MQFACFSNVVSRLLTNSCLTRDVNSQMGIKQLVFQRATTQFRFATWLEFSSTFLEFEQKCFPGEAEGILMEASSIFSSRSHQPAPTAGPAPSGSTRKHCEVTLNNTTNTFMPTNLAAVRSFMPQINQRDSPARKKIAVWSISFVCRVPLSQHVFLAIDQS